MTNTEKLLGKIAIEKIKMKTICMFLGITYASLKRKIWNESEFRASEIDGLCELLNIGDKDEYFFWHRVDE